MHFTKARDGSGCQDRRVSKLAPEILEKRISRNFRAALHVVHPHFRRHAGPGPGVEVDHAIRAAFRMKKLETAHAAKAAHERVDDHLCERRGERCIEGIAARR